MTILALRAEEPNVNFRFSVAADAFPRRPAKHFVLMTFGAFQIGVSACQWKTLRVIEMAQAVNAVVAIQAGFSELLPMFCHEDRILVSVATNTGLDFKGTQVLWVTTLTGKRLLLIIEAMTNQTEAGLCQMGEQFAIQPCWRPPLRGMTILAIRVEHSLMRLRLRVAFAAGVRRSLEVTFFVTASARSFSVLPFQWIGGLAVVEIAHTVEAIMTIQTAFAKIADVLCHEGTIVKGVAVAAYLFGYGISLPPSVTRGAFHRRGVVIHLMPGQAESCHRMIETRQGVLGGVEGASTMVGVAFETTLHLKYTAMQPALDVKLLSDVGVTGQTKSSLSRGKGAVAVAAGLLEIGVGAKVLQGHADDAFFAQRAGAKSQSAILPNRKNQAEQKRQYQNEANGIEKGIAMFHALEKWESVKLGSKCGQSYSRLVH